MSEQLYEMSGEEIGRRLRIARESAGITQAEAAATIAIARTTLVALEQGQRRIRMDELRRLSALYGTTVNQLMRREAVQVDLVPRFRRLPASSDEAASRAVELLSDLAKAEVELENLLGVQRAMNYPPERPLLSGDVSVQAECNANELREKLGIGSAPIPDITAFLEMELGVRVYVRKIDSRISGLFSFDEALGPCILLNANHPQTRRNQTAAHECGHFISTRREPEVTEAGEKENSREERYANAFSRAFLMPSRTVMQKFHELTAGSARFTRRHVILLAHIFAVSREALVRRVEELKLVKYGTWEYFQAQGGITNEQERQVLGDERVNELQNRTALHATSLRLHLLAAEAYRQQLLSESQLARLLRMDRIELREVIDDSELQGSEDDALPELDQ